MEPRSHHSRKPRPSRRQVQVRDLGHRGVPETNRTSFRLDPEDRAGLKLVAERMFGGVTMSAALRILIREAVRVIRAQDEGRDQGQAREGGPGNERP